MRNRKHAALLCMLAAALPLLFSPRPSAGAERPVHRWITFFFSPTCHECQKVKDEYLPRMQEKYAGVFIEYRDIGTLENFQRLAALSRQKGAHRQVEVPAVYFEGELLTGREEIEGTLEGLIRKSSPGPQGSPSVSAPYDPFSHFRSFTPAAVAAAGLVDGINPCAFTVIVFFVSFLALQGFRRRQLAVIGACFIAGVFITYLLIGFGIFGFFYKLGSFWVVRSAVNWIVGLASICFGAAAVIDAVRFARTGKTDGMILSLPRSVKERIHAVIGMRYRGAAADGARATMPRLAATAFVTGFLVSLLEAVCTGQMYLPTIVFVLKSAPANFAAFGYLVLYNVMFIAPLAVILVLSVLGVSSGQFGRFMSRHMLAVKLLMASLFFLLGGFLLWKGI